MGIGLYVCGMIIAAIFCVCAITTVVCVLRDDEEVEEDA